jgi:hypothetical protein
MGGLGLLGLRCGKCFCVCVCDTPKTCRYGQLVAWQDDGSCMLGLVACLCILA